MFAIQYHPTMCIALFNKKLQTRHDCNCSCCTNGRSQTDLGLVCVVHASIYMSACDARICITSSHVNVNKQYARTSLQMTMMHCALHMQTSALGWVYVMVKQADNRCTVHQGPCNDACHYQLAGWLSLQNVMGAPQAGTGRGKVFRGSSRSSSHSYPLASTASRICMYIP